jgi:hypothetical protein
MTSETYRSRLISRPNHFRFFSTVLKCIQQTPVIVEIPSFTPPAPLLSLSASALVLGSSYMLRPRHSDPVSRPLFDPLKTVLMNTTSTEPTSHLHDTDTTN